MIKLTSSINPVHSLKDFKCALEENLLSGSHRGHVSGNEMEAPTIILAELEQKPKSPPQRGLTIKIRLLISKEWTPVPLKLRTLNLQIFKSLSYLRKYSFSSQPKMYSHPHRPHPEIFLLKFWTEEINPSLSAKPAVIFFRRDVWKDNTEFPQGPPVDYN